MPNRQCDVPGGGGFGADVSREKDCAGSPMTYQVIGQSADVRGRGRGRGGGGGGGEDSETERGAEEDFFSLRLAFPFVFKMYKKLGFGCFTV